MSATPGRPIITLLTDFGPGSYVASVKGVLLSLAPASTIVDITHEVAPGAIGSAGFLLRHTATHFPPGTVHVCVVDPGVGTERMPLIVQANGATFVGPDNGIFHEVMRRWSDGRAYRVDTGPWLPDSVCPTFHGRDLFAPVAGRIARGEPVSGFGTEVDPGRLAPSPIPPPRKRGSRITGQVVWVDTFGNLITNIERRDVEKWSEGGTYRVHIGWEVIEKEIRTFQDVERGSLAHLYGSWETVEVVVSEGSAAERLGVAAGETIRLERTCDGE